MATTGHGLRTDGASICYLRQRITAGDLTALADPTLPRLLEAECQQSWWHEGLRSCTDALLGAYINELTPEETSRAVEAWGAALAPEVATNKHWEHFLQRLRLESDPGERTRRVRGLVDHLWAQAPSARTWGASAIFRLLRQLRGKVSEAPVEADNALRMLTRYAC